VTAPATNALSYNAYVQQIGILAVALTSETAGVWSFNDAPLQGALPSILNYAELRCARDLDTLSSQGSKIYTLTAGQAVFAVPVNDFFTVQTVEVLQMSGGSVVNACPLVPVSKEMIQNVYGGLASSNTPKFYALVGDALGGNQDTSTNILFGPPPSFGFSIRVTGTARAPSLYQNAVAGIADTGFTYLSQWYPDLLLMASMIYITMYQRNFGNASDDPQMGMTYEKQYQALRLAAIAEENRKKLEGSAWSAYSTPTAATPTR
jgi:hypothetical protein